jgi:uncharacterized membrane protein (GlpM family)
MEHGIDLLNTLITHLELFGIGFSFGVMGPCFLSCTPGLIAYVVGSSKRQSQALAKITTFLMGRLFAYAVLGWLAGLSGGIIRRFLNPDQTLFLRPLAGVVTVILGIFVLLGAGGDLSICRFARSRLIGLSGVFSLGFAVGIAPCAPLSVLLLQIIFMSKGPFEGLRYALSFGAGTFFSGFIVVAGIAGILVWLPAKVLKSTTAGLVFRLALGLLLIILGTGFILNGMNR